MLESSQYQNGRSISPMLPKMANGGVLGQVSPTILNEVNFDASEITKNLADFQENIKNSISESLEKALQAKGKIDLYTLLEAFNEKNANYESFKEDSGF